MFHVSEEMRYAIHVGGLGVRWYSIFAFLVLFGGWRLCRRVVSRRAFGPDARRISVEDVDGLFLLLPPLAIIGARLVEMVFYQTERLRADPMSLFAFADGGMSSHGVALGVLLACAIWARSRRIPLLSALDLVVIALPLYPCLIRLGNFLNAELYGVPTTGPWGVVFAGAGPLPRHPTQLYEAALEGVGLLILNLALLRAGALARPGLITAAFLCYYPPVRAFCEIWKENEPGLVSFGPLPTATVLSIPMFLAGLALAAHVFGQRQRRAADRLIGSRS